MAERVGFEPTVLLLVQRFSRPPRSTTPAPLRMCGLGVRGGVYRDERQIARGKSQISRTLFHGLLGRAVRNGLKVWQARANLRLWRAVPGGVKGHSVVDSSGQKR